MKIPYFVINPVGKVQEKMREEWIKRNPNVKIPTYKKELSGVNKVVYDNINPFGYGNRDVETNPNFINKVKSIANKLFRSDGALKDEELKLSPSTRRRDDAWRMYLGGDESYQRYNTLKKSNNRPSLEKDKNSKYYTFVDDKVKDEIFESYKIDHLDKEDLGTLEEIALTLPNETLTDEEKEVKETIFMNREMKPFEKKRLMDNRAKVMGEYTLTPGEDDKGYYVSFYDKWDLSPNFFEGQANKPLQAGQIGKPFEIYDRIYYHPVTKEVIKNPTKKPENARILPKVYVTASKLQRGGLLEEFKQLGKLAKYYHEKGDLEEVRKIYSKQEELLSNNKDLAESKELEKAITPYDKDSPSGIMYFYIPEDLKATQQRIVYRKNKDSNNYDIFREVKYNDDTTKLIKISTSNTRKPDTKFEKIEDILEYKKGGWLQKAINPKHKGYCTPITKKTCTPRRKALALTLKKYRSFK